MAQPSLRDSTTAAFHPAINGWANLSVSRRETPTNDNKNVGNLRLAPTAQIGAEASEHSAGGGQAR